MGSPRETGNLTRVAATASNPSSSSNSRAAISSARDEVFPPHSSSSDGNVRALKIITNSIGQKDDGKINPSSPALVMLRRMSKFSLFVSCVLFLCLLVIMGCLCRPMLLTGGLWVALLFLGQGSLGLRAVNSSTRPLLLGHAWLSGVVALVAIGSTAYIFSGHLLIACISAFHYPDEKTVLKLYIVEVAALIASIPSLIGGFTCMISAVLAVKAAQIPKVQHQPPMIFYLSDWNENHANFSLPSNNRIASAPSDVESRPGTPPPSYNQVVYRESFA